MTTKIKLTKTMREGFVAAVLADVHSKLDDDAIRKMVMEEALQALPVPVLAVYQDINTQHYVNKRIITLPGVYRAKGPNGSSRYIQAPAVSVPGSSDFKISDKLKVRLLKITQEYADRLDEKEALGTRLNAMAGACNNTEELEDMFPLLTKYIPVPLIVPKSMVPMVQIKDTMKELRRLGVPPKQAVAA